MIPLLAITLLARPSALYVDHALRNVPIEGIHTLLNTVRLATAPCDPAVAYINGIRLQVVLPLTGTIEVRMVGKTPNFNIDFAANGVTIQGAGWALSNRVQYSTAPDLAIPLVAGKMQSPWMCQ